MKKLPEMAPNRGQENFFSPDPDLLDILSDTDFGFDNFYLLLFGIPISRIPDVSGFPDSWISRFPDSRILQSGSWPWLAVARWGHQSLDLDGTPGPQNSGDPRN